MPETPIAALLIMFIFICAWAVREGIETLMSFAYWFVVITSVVIAFIFLLLVGEMDFRAFLPAFQLPLMKYVQGTHIVSAIPLCEIIVFLMVVPRLRLQEKVAKSFYMGFLIGTVTLLVIIIRDTAVLENMLSYVTLPSYEAVKLIDIGDIITRMEVLYAIELLFLQFFKVSILYWAFIFGFAQIFHLRTYKPYVLIAGILIISLSISIFDSSLENANWGHSTAPFYSSIFQLLIPGITLVGAFLRNMFRKMEVKRE